MMSTNSDSAEFHEMLLARKAMIDADIARLERLDNLGRKTLLLLIAQVVAFSSRGTASAQLVETVESSPAGGPYAKVEAGPDVSHFAEQAANAWLSRVTDQFATDKQQLLQDASKQVPSGRTGRVTVSGWSYSDGFSGVAVSTYGQTNGTSQNSDAKNSILEQGGGTGFNLVGTKGSELPAPGQAELSEQSKQEMTRLNNEIQAADDARQAQLREDAERVRAELEAKQQAEKQAAAEAQKRAEDEARRRSENADKGVHENVFKDVHPDKAVRDGSRDVSKLA